MAGLVLTLKPYEKFLVNGALLENGPKRGQIRIENPDVNVLRVSDALRPDEVDTPVRRVYFASQLILSGDIKEKEVRSEIVEGLEALTQVFKGLAEIRHIEKALKSARERKYYSILCSLKPVLSVESSMLLHAEKKQPHGFSALPHAVAG